MQATPLSFIKWGQQKCLLYSAWHTGGAQYVSVAAVMMVPLCLEHGTAGSLAPLSPDPLLCPHPIPAMLLPCLLSQMSPDEFPSHTVYSLRVCLLPGSTVRCWAPRKPSHPDAAGETGACQEERMELKRKGSQGRRELNSQRRGGQRRL